MCVSCFMHDESGVWIRWFGGKRGLSGMRCLLVRVWRIGFSINMKPIRSWFAPEIINQPHKWQIMWGIFHLVVLW